MQRKYPNRAKEIINSLKDIATTKALVGFFDSENAMKAWKNEKGTVGTGIKSTNKQSIIPPRPFFASGAESGAKENNITYQFKDNLKKALGSKDSKGLAKKAFEALAQGAVEGVKKGIDKVQEPKLARYTIKQRKLRGNDSAKPLIDTGKMRESVKYKIRRGKVAE